jgi:uncharacterized NAD(P)/FAD-binding protein YdhS
VCIVGAGPRGVSVLERLCASVTDLAVTTAIKVHVVDPHRPGAGQVWRTWQPRHLLMNTVASQVTVFTDHSVDLDGPVAPGPSLYEWAKHRVPHDRRHGADVVAEARGLGPDSYSTRAFYGHYLEWAFDWIVCTAPAQVSVVVHRARAVGLDDVADPFGGQTVSLENGTTLTGVDAVVLAQGHLGARLTAAEARLERFAVAGGLTYVAPANPADVDLSGVATGEPVLLRGLGLNFFDYLALLTAGRGGRFERRAGELVYLPSGAEPMIYAGSRRGVPHHARGENEKGAHGRHEPVLLTSAAADRLRRRGALDFRRDLWPLVAAEVETVYYSTLLADRSGESFRRRYLAAAGRPEDQRALLDRHGVAPHERWDWDRVARPHHGREFTGLADFRAWLLARLRSDVVDAHAGNVSGPVKAALDVLRDLRNEIRTVVDHGGLTGASYRDDLDRWYTPLNAFLSIGPPVRRVAEMIALIEAGVLVVLGPGLEVDVCERTGLFRAGSTVPGSELRVATVIEARLPEPDLPRTTDPLLCHLLATGQCSAYRIANPAGDHYETGGLAVTERPYHLVDAMGRAHPRRFAFGVPTESVHWVTAAGARPGVNSVTLADADAIARSVLVLGRPHAATPSMSRTA